MPDDSATPATQAVETIFSDALSRPADERAKYIEGACGDDWRLRARVEALLRAHEAPEGFLPERGENLLPELNPAGEEPLGATEKPGDTIGRYKLLEKIGEGGFGIVYVAEQKEPVKRRVALKLIKLGMDTRQVVARFQAERQALALMDHPSIAKVFDAGATDTGRPYFVMELVQGIRITDYCDQNQLSTRQRLELFIQVCRAVQHAHQKGIIHRDLKPSNILVTRDPGESGVPKIIDFGIAKATQAELTEQPVFTQFGQFIGTPAYISPEQAELSRLDVDTRSDIYSLGVLLYELLTGTTPFETSELLAAGWEEMRRTIKHQEPVRPSTRLSTLAPAALTPIAQRRQADPPKLIHSVRGDLDWIVMKCLEKDRTQRYETANGLARDLQRHLDNEPVVARPRNKLYEFERTVRRHKLGFAATVAVVIALVCGMVASSWEAARARRAEYDQTRLRRLAEQASQNATERLWGSYLSEARARRRSGELGQRFASLAALSNAAAIRPSLELRNEAIACMALADLRLVTKRQVKEFQEYVSPDRALQRYALSRSNGISIRRISDDKELIHLATPWGEKSGGNPCFSLDGKTLMAVYNPGGTNEWDQRDYVWDLSSATVRKTKYPGIPTADHKSLLSLQSNSIVLYDLAHGQEVKRVVLAEPISDFISVNPDCRLIALTDAAQTNLFVIELQSATKIATLPHPDFVFGVGWHPSGQYAVTVCADNLLYIWNLATGERIRTLEGHRATPVNASFSHDGKFLASNDWEYRLRLWDFETGRQLLTVPGGGLATFGPGDVALVLTHYNADGFEWYEFASGREAQTIYQRGRVPGAPGGWGYFSGDGRWLAYDTAEGATLFDLRTHRIAGTITGRIRVWGFDAGDHNVLGGIAVNDHESRAFRWPVDGARPLTNAGAPPGVAPGVQEFGRPQPAFASSAAGSTLQLSESIISPTGWMSHDRALCAVTDGLRCSILRTDSLTEQARTAVQRGMRWAAFSPDGKLVATSAFHAVGVKVWDTVTGDLRKELPTEGEGGTTVFTRDGRWLVVGTAGGFQFYDVGTWARGLCLSKPAEVDLMVIPAFAPDGSIMAVSSLSGVRLFRAATGEILADLVAPSAWHSTCLSFSPDGTQLAVCEGHSALRVWDLRAIREQLAQMHLDWDLPPYPAEIASGSAK